MAKAPAKLIARQYGALPFRVEADGGVTMPRYSCVTARLRLDANGESELEAHAAPGAHKIFAVAAVSIANGGDNIATYTPPFASRGGYEIGIFIAVFLAMIALWCFAARWLVRHPTLGAPVRRYGHRLLPVILIGLGALILYQAGTLRLLRR